MRRIEKGFLFLSIFVRTRVPGTPNLHSSVSSMPRRVDKRVDSRRDWEERWQSGGKTISGEKPCD